MDVTHPSSDYAAQHTVAPPSIATPDYASQPNTAAVCNTQPGSYHAVQHRGAPATIAQLPNDPLCSGYVQQHPSAPYAVPHCATATDCTMHLPSTPESSSRPTQAPIDCPAAPYYTSTPSGGNSNSYRSTKLPGASDLESEVAPPGGFLRELLSPTIDLNPILQGHTNNVVFSMTESCESFNNSEFPLHSSLDNMSFHSSLFELSSQSNNSGIDLSQLSQGNNYENQRNLSQQFSSIPAGPFNTKRPLEQSIMPSPIQNSTKHQRKKSGRTDRPPLSDSESAWFDDLFARKVYNLPDSTDLTCKLGTKTVQYMRIPDSYVSMSEASDRTKRRRVSFSKKLREKLNSSLPDELCRMPSNEKAEVCKAAGITTGHVSKEEALALKTTAELSWSKLRKINRFYSNKGVNHEGEKSVRSFKQEILGDHLETVTMDFKVKDEESPYGRDGYVIVKQPCTLAKSLKDVIMHQLDQLHKKNKLTWHGGKIPEDQIWVKLDGDKGGDISTTKCGFQIVNVEKPNSPANHVLICQFPAADSMHNLEVALERFGPEIPEIKAAVWNGKSLKLFIAGDLDWYYKNEGLGGGSGMCPCPWCVIPKSEMQFKPSERAKGYYARRTLKRIREQFEKYKEAGCPRKKQSQYENVVNKPILDIEPEDYCPSELHITMGSTKRVEGHYVIDLHGLDFDIGESLAQFDIALGKTPFDTFVSVKKFILITEERLLEIEDELDDLRGEDDGTLTLEEINEYVEKLNEEKVQLLTRQADLEAKLKLPSQEAGPLVHAHEKVLKKHGIVKQRFHGKSFIGNDCHTYLKEEVYTDVFDTMVETCKTLTGDPEIINRAQVIAQKYKEEKRLYSIIHRLIAHSKHVPSSNLPVIQEAIDSYLEYYRREFPNSSIPVKYHILEDHIVDWLRRYPFGFGLLGEQGAESVHAFVNRITPNYHAVRSSEKQQQLIVEDQHLKCSPHLVGLVPEPNQQKNTAKSKSLLGASK